MLITNIVLAALGMILLPLIAGFFVARKFKLSFKDFRKLFVAGALTFIASQILHIPLLIGLTALFSKGQLPSLDESIALLFNAIVLGLLAGIFEETARYILFKWFRNLSDTWRNSIVIGLGHGGIEAILVGILSLATLTQMMVMKNMTDFSALEIPADQVEFLKTQVNAYWSQTSIVPYFGLMERASAMSLHIGLSMFVLLSVLTNQRKWFWFALFYHAFVDAFAVFTLPRFIAMQNSALGTFLFECIIAIMGVGWLIFAIRSSNKFPVEKEASTN
jgi:uncharacterized membrane protein YhfC